MGHRVLTLKVRKLIADMTSAELKAAGDLAALQQMAAIIQNDKRVLKRATAVLELITQIKETRKK